MVVPAESRGLARREFHPATFECPRCGFNLWHVLRKRAIRNSIEHLCCLGAGLAVGLPLSWHHLLTLARFLIRPL